MAPPAELSLRYLPDMSADSDTGALRPEYSDSSFQIPMTLGGTSNDMLLAESSMDFLRDDTISTPAMRNTHLRTASRPNFFPKITEPLATNQNPLTIAELTPRRQRNARRSPPRSSLKPHLAPEIVVPSPLRRAVEQNLAAAIEDDCLSFEPRPPVARLLDDMSFAIPIGGRVDNLLDDDGDFLGEDDSPFGGPSNRAPAAFAKQPPLTLSQLTPRAPKRPVGDDEPIPKLDSVDEMLKFLRAESGKLDESTVEDAVPTEPEAEPALERAPSPFDVEEPPSEVEIDAQAPTANEGGTELPAGSPVDEHITQAPQSASHIEQICGPISVPEAQKLEVEPQENSQRKRAVVSGGISKPSKAKAPQTVTGQKRSSSQTKEKSTMRQKVETQRARRSPPAAATTGRERSKALSKTSAAPEPKPKPPAKSTARPAPAVTAESVPASGSDLCCAPPAPGGLAALLMSYGERITQQEQQRPVAEIGPGESGTVADVDQGEDLAAASDDDAVEKGLSDPSEIGLRATVPGTSAPGAEDTLCQDSVTELAVSQPQASVEEVMQVETAASAPSEDSAGPAAEIVASSRAPAKRPASAASGRASQRRKRAKVSQAPAASSSAGLLALNEKIASTTAGKPAASGKPRALQASRTKNAPPSTAAGLSASAPSLDASGKASPGPGTGPVDAKDTAAARDLAAHTGASAQAPGAAREKDGGARTGGGQLTEAGRASSRAKGRSGDRQQVQTRAQAQRARERGRTPDAMGVTVTDGHAPADRPAASAAQPAARPTKPVEFHFASDARLGARLTQSDGSSAPADAHARSLSGARHAVPDFKALHALHASQAAARAPPKPLVPAPLELATDARAREREAFEAARRERERAAELLAEERRRAREAEEEREVRELRRRAVPRAHEVPEWYASAPKRARRA